MFRDALQLVEDPQTLYASVPDDVRRHLNQTFYERLYIDDTVIDRDQETPLFAELQAAKHAFFERTNVGSGNPALSGASFDGNEKSPRQTGALRFTGTDSLALASVFSDAGSNRNVLVGLTGFEPATT